GCVDPGWRPRPPACERFQDSEVVAVGGSRDEDLFEAELVEVAGAAYSDDLAVLEAFARRWPRPPSWIDAPETMLHAVSHAHCALLNGQTDLARKSLADLPRDRGGLSPVPIGFSDALLGLTYLWEGKPQLAADSLRQSLAMAERRMDRRNRVVCTLAALLAQACLQIGDVEEAQRRLALRLPVIEKEAIPDGAIAAFLCLGEIAGEQGRQDQASVQFASLAAEGAARGSPRMQAAASFALTRFHSGRGRPHLATEEAKRARSIVAGLDVDASPAIRNWCELHACLAEATAAVNSAKAGAQLEAVTAAASEALRLATRLNRGADVARALFLRAQCVRPEDPRRADTDRDEAVSLCRASAHWRLLAEFDEADPGRPLSTTALPVSAPVQSAAPADDPRSILTPREQDVLTRLTQRMSNKEIAQSIGLGEETVKWHLKNLFQKLGAHDRVSAVSRARLLGFI
ncbi:response regulator transcription factor, partial [Bradyrhizobium sp.]|uniref:response regulator transcription factor n=1 Tax=Bradyrhizobium sp. TaxID=376 RepID=UPI00391CFA41